jgi:hypothetical protein
VALLGCVNQMIHTETWPLAPWNRRSEIASDPRNHLWKSTSLELYCIFLLRSLSGKMHRVFTFDSSFTFFLAWGWEVWEWSGAAELFPWWSTDGNSYTSANARENDVFFLFLFLFFVFFS